MRDVGALLEDGPSCRQLLQTLCKAPALIQPPGGAVAALASGGLFDGTSVRSGLPRRSLTGVLRVATWNIAGGHWSCAAPASWKLPDQRAAIVAEVQRWRTSLECDVVALQECEEATALPGLESLFDFAASVPAADTRGFVHLYVRRGLSWSEFDAGRPSCVAVRISRPELAEEEDGSEASLVIAAVHLPHGERPAQRLDVIARACRAARDAGYPLLVCGDFNAKDDEVASLCRSTQLQEALYNGKSWMALGNRFYADSPYSGPGLRYDRHLFGAGLWAEAHLVGQGKVFFEGQEFFMSDHFGVMAYVDQSRLHAFSSKRPGVAAGARRAQLFDAKDPFLFFPLGASLYGDVSGSGFSSPSFARGRVGGGRSLV